jgi:hypothetical protein
MSTKESIWYGEDKAGRACHIYWELAERDVEKGSAPIYVSLERDLAELTFKLSPELAERLRAFLAPDSTWKVS